MEVLIQKDPELATEIKNLMFVFEDLILVDDKNFREILQNVENDIVVKALKTASDEMKEKISLTCEGFGFNLS